jgi:hypothetical protein
VFNTYQAYLRQKLNDVRIDLHLAQREDFHFACKLVRGAYMDQERKRAALVGYPDPIHATIEVDKLNLNLIFPQSTSLQDTSKMYHDVFCEILNEWTIRPAKVFAVDLEGFTYSR